MGKNLTAQGIDEKNLVKEFTLDNIISYAITVPGVKVDRRQFLAEIFSVKTDDVQAILDEGPIAAGIDQDALKKISHKLILERTAQSSITSGAMGIPGGLAMMATIPVDMLQVYATTLKLVQELMYIYGAQDIWKNGQVDEEIVQNQLILYCGVMLGVSIATAGVRVLATQMAKVALKKLPQKALTKTFWYPIIKSIGKSIGLTITKKSLANGVSKAIPVIGGVVSGTMTFVSMKSMAEKLQATLEEVNFHYTEEEFNKDIEIVEGVQSEEIQESKKESLIEKGKEKISALFHKKNNPKEDNLDKIKKLKELLDMGAITQEEFDAKKKSLLEM